MGGTQDLSTSNARFTLHCERLGPLPLINHFLERMGLERLLEKHVPTTDRRTAMTHAQALGVLLRSIIVEREPIYRQQEFVTGFAPGLFGVTAEAMERMTDDRLGRALDRLFDADRNALLTEAVVTIGKRFGVAFDQLHNDSTSISFCGQYREAKGREIRGRTAPAIVWGHSKDLRPDLKQLLFILTVTADGVPASFRCADGNTNDAVTHIETWETLRTVAGRADFLYVADSKLCTYANMDYIHRAGGRFVTVMPRTRQEDGQFRKWLQTQTPNWELVWDRPNPHHQDGPADRWYVFQPEVPSMEAWPITWVWSTLLTLHQNTRRQRQITAATEQLEALHQSLLKAKSRRGAKEIDQRVADIIEKFHVGRYLQIQRTVREEHTFKQTRRGRPGPDMAYRKVTRRRFDIEWSINKAAVAYDEMSDGMYPLLCNDRQLTAAQILQAHKGQPTIEKRFEQVKTVYEIAPVFLKNEGRIEALFTVYFFALLVQALIERELRLAMAAHGHNDLPLYPEQRKCRHPTTEKVLRLFSLAQRNRLCQGDQPVQLFDTTLSEFQLQILELLGVPKSAYLAGNQKK
jgi:transposase